MGAEDLFLPYGTSEISLCPRITHRLRKTKNEILKLQETGFSYDGIILNAGGYTHTSVAIADAVAAIKTPVLEVHISNVYAREEYRHVSLMAKNCKGVIAGFGLDSYRLAVEAIVSPRPA